MLDLGDGDRQQLPFAQQLAHVLDGVAFDDALRSRPAVSRAVYSKAPTAALAQSSRVTRRTSSMVVSPRSTLSRPSSRIEGVSVRA